MGEFISEKKVMGYSGTDGHMYYDGTEEDNGTLWTAARNEPVMDFGNPLRKDLLNEIWFNLSETCDYTIYVKHRGGNTVGEAINADWKSCDNLSGDDPELPIVRLKATDNQAYRYHQIQWFSSGTVPMQIREIIFDYNETGPY